MPPPPQRDPQALVGKCVGRQHRERWVKTKDAPNYIAMGWTLMLSDDEFPVPTSTPAEPPPNVQSGPTKDRDPADERPPDYGEA